MSDQQVNASSQSDLIGQITRFSRAFHRMKMTLTKEMPDRAAYNLLYPLMESDKRASDIADIVHSDPSTVSRHIADLVRNELVHRIADQKDGRSSLLSLTEKGKDLCRSMRSQREAALASALKNWPDSDIKELTRLLTHLNNDIEANYNEVLDGFRQAFNDVENPTNTDSTRASSKRKENP